MLLDTLVTEGVPSMNYFDIRFFTMIVMYLGKIQKQCIKTMGLLACNTTLFCAYMVYSSKICCLMFIKSEAIVWRSHKSWSCHNHGMELLTSTVDHIIVLKNFNASEGQQFHTGTMNRSWLWTTRFFLAGQFHDFGYY